MVSENANGEPPPSKEWNLAQPAVFLATGFGAGLLPRAPGTWGSLLAVGLAWGIVHLWGTLALAAGVVLAFAVGVWVSGVCIEKYGGEDPKQVVIDEIAGQWAVLLFVPLDLIHYGVGFVLFRVFDIFKPWPVSWADREIKGGLGVMADDALAAAYAAAVLWGVAWVMGG